MKILITTDAYQNMINGVAVSVRNLYSALKAQGDDVRILTLSPTNHSYREDDIYYIRSKGFSIYPDARATLAFSDSLLSEILDWKPDIIHSQCEFFTFLFAKKLSRKLNIPVIHTYHTLYEYYTPYFCPNKTLGKKIVALASRFVCNQTDAVIAPTEKTARILDDYGVRSPLHVIPTGLDLRHLQKPVSSTDVLKIRTELGIPSNATVLVTLGRVASEKNIDFLIRCMTDNRLQNCHLVIVGDGPARSELGLLVTKLQLTEKVHFTGMVSPNQVSTFYHLGDLFVSASQSETQGLTYIEAMACGLPLLCRKDLCLQSVLRHGHNGYFFQNQEDFVQHLMDMQRDNNMLHSMGLCALKTANAFSKEAFAERVKQCYSQTIIFREESGVCSPFACIPRLIWPRGMEF